MGFEELVGKHRMSGIEEGRTEHMLSIYGIEEVNYVKFTLDGITYRALEDPDDGFRSYCQNLETVEEECKIKLPDIEVVCECSAKYGDYEADMIIIKDAENGLPILELGTANTDDYYPFCVMEWMPKNIALNRAKMIP